LYLDSLSNILKLMAIPKIPVFNTLNLKNIICGLPPGKILSSFRGSVTNNNGFWIGLLDLLTLL
jgi:hypothetical protein